ncbi:hypothetical protein P5673_002196, partial [Acropora cervicornis]
YLLPLISATVFLDTDGGNDFASIFKLTTTFVPLAVILAIISASSIVMQAVVGLACDHLQNSWSEDHKVIHEIRRRWPTRLLSSVSALVTGNGRTFIISGDLCKVKRMV